MDSALAPMEGHQTECIVCRLATQHNCPECGQGLHKPCAVVVSGTSWDDESAELFCPTCAPRKAESAARARPGAATGTVTAGPGGPLSDWDHERNPEVPPGVAIVACALIHGLGDELYFAEAGGAVNATHVAPVFDRNAMKARRQGRTQAAPAAAPAVESGPADNSGGGGSGGGGSGGGGSGGGGSSGATGEAPRRGRSEKPKSQAAEKQPTGTSRRTKRSAASAPYHRNGDTGVDMRELDVALQRKPSTTIGVRMG